MPLYSGRRPATGSNFLTAEWRKLAIINYVVDSAILTPYLPYKTELDLWNGKCYISLVGFRFINTRVKGVSVPFHRHFEEVNLRFYVKYKDAGGWKHGVTFIKEIVPKRALTFIANTIYKEKYVTLPMKHRWDTADNLVSAAYSWKLGRAWNSFSVKANPAPLDIQPGSEEEFITEHYWGYTHINSRTCAAYGVEHPRWIHYQVTGYEVDVAFDKVYNKDFAILKYQVPDSVMLVEGSEISVRSMRRIM